MKKKLILALLTAVGVFMVSFAADIFDNYSLKNNNDATSARAIDVAHYVEVEKEDIIKIYQKYNSLVSDIYNKYNLDFKKLNESEEDLDFSSRLVCMDVEEPSNIKNTWFGIVYDEENNPKEISFYVDGEYEDYNTSENVFSIKNTLIEDVGDLFFPHTKFKSDIERFFNDVTSEPGVNSSTFAYKKGIVTASINGGKISIKLNLIG